MCLRGQHGDRQPRERRRRKPAYVCTNHRERGKAVCANRLRAPMEAADRAVLSAVERDLLRPEVLEEALREAVRVLHLPECAFGGVLAVVLPV